MADTVLVEFKVNSAGAISSVRQFSGEVKKAGTSAATSSRGVLSLSSALKGLGVTIGAVKVIQFFKSSVAAATAQEQTFQRLATNLGNVGVAYSDVSRDLLGLFNQLQETTQYGDTDTAEVLATLTAITGDYDAAVKLLVPTLDTATATQKDANTIAEALGKAVQGQIGSLSRYGIVLDEATKKQLANADAGERARILAEKLDEAFGGAASNMETYGTRVQRLGNFWGDLKEAIGSVYTTIAGAPGVFDFLIDKIKALTEWVKDFGEVLVFAFNFDFWGILVETFQMFLNQFKLLGAQFLEVLSEIFGYLGKLPGKVGESFRDWQGGLVDTIATMREEVERDAGIWGSTYEEAFNKANEAALGFRENVELLVTANENVKDTAQEAAQEVGTVYERILDLETRVYEALAEARAEAAEEAAQRTEQSWQDLENSLEGMDLSPVPEPSEQGRRLEIIEGIWESTLGRMYMAADNALKDVLYLAFTGQFDEIENAWKGFVNSLAGALTEGLVDSITAAFTTALEGGAEGEGVEGATGGLFGALGSTRIWQQAGMAVGVGFMAQAQESGSLWEGILGGALAGAMYGAPAGGIGAIPGALIGAVFGAVTSLFGGSSDNTPRSSAALNLITGQGGLTTENQGMSTTAMHTWVSQRLGEYQQAFSAYRDILQLFQDSSLWDLVGEVENFTTGGFVDITADQLAAFFRENWLPEAMETAFGQAIEAGLRGYNVDSNALARLWEELDLLPGEQRMDALRSYISSIVGSSQLLESMDWGAITAEAGLSSMEQFFQGMEQIQEQVELAFMGFDDLDLLQRAQEAENINALIAAARQAEIQMLRQIDSLQKSINRSIESQIEDIMTGGMSDSERRSYYLEQISGIMDRLRAGVSDPETLQQLMSDLQGYVSGIQGIMGEDLYQTLPDGRSWADYLMDILREAQGLSDDNIENMRARIEETNEALINQLQALIEAITHWEDSVTGGGGDGGGGAGGGEQGIPWWKGGGEPSIDLGVTVNVYNRTSIPIETMIDARVAQILGAGGGPQIN